MLICRNNRTTLTLVKSEPTASAIVSQCNHVTSNFGKSLEYAQYGLFLTHKAESNILNNNCAIVSFPFLEWSLVSFHPQMNRIRVHLNQTKPDQSFAFFLVRIRIWLHAHTSPTELNFEGKHCVVVLVGAALMCNITFCGVLVLFFFGSFVPFYY